MDLNDIDILKKRIIYQQVREVYKTSFPIKIGTPSDKPDYKIYRSKDEQYYQIVIRREIYYYKKIGEK